MLGYAIGEHAMGSVRGQGITTLVRGDPSVGGDAVAEVPSWWHVPNEPGQVWQQMLNCGWDMDGLVENAASSCGFTVAEQDSVFSTAIPWPVSVNRWRVNWYNANLSDTSSSTIQTLPLANPGAEDGDTIPGTNFTPLYWNESSSSGEAMATRIRTWAFEGDRIFDSYHLQDAGMIWQDVAIDDTNSSHARIDLGQANLRVTWQQKGVDDARSAAELDSVRMMAEFYSSSMGMIGDRLYSSQHIAETGDWQQKTWELSVPPGTRTVRLFLRCERSMGLGSDDYLEAFVDDIQMDLRLRDEEYTIRQVWEVTSSVQPDDYPKPGRIRILP